MIEHCRARRNITSKVNCVTIIGVGLVWASKFEPNRSIKLSRTNFWDPFVVKFFACSVGQPNCPIWCSINASQSGTKSCTSSDLDWSAHFCKLYPFSILLMKNL